MHVDLLEAYEGFFFDMDGVLYLGNTPIPHAVETLRTLQQRGRRIALVTNNSSQSEPSVIRRLEDLGFNSDQIEVVVATTLTARWLAEHLPGGHVYVVGAPELKAEIERAGLTVASEFDTSGRAPDCLVVGNYRNIDFHGLQQAIRIGRSGAIFVAVNRDPVYPGEEGLIPGAGPLVDAIAAGIGREPDVLLGKPAAFPAKVALERVGLRPDQCLMVGDTLQIDVRMAQEVGMDSALVLTGVDTLDTLQKSEIKPTYVLQTIAELVDGPRVNRPQA